WDVLVAVEGTARRHPNAPSRASQHVVAPPTFPIHRTLLLPPPAHHSLLPATCAHSRTQPHIHHPPTLIVCRCAHPQAAAHVRATRTPGARTFCYHRHVLCSHMFLQAPGIVVSCSALLARSRGIKNSPLGSSEPVLRLVSSSRRPGRKPRTWRRSSGSVLALRRAAHLLSRPRRLPIQSRRSHSAPTSAHGRSMAYGRSVGACKPSQATRTELRAADCGHKKPIQAST
ncbi:hypothetical protein K523DRAFT_378521, partial [Schizophyllum commune Tattone D]